MHTHSDLRFSVNLDLDLTVILSKSRPPSMKMLKPISQLGQAYLLSQSPSGTKVPLYLTSQFWRMTLLQRSRKRTGPVVRLLASKYSFYAHTY